MIRTDVRRAIAKVATAMIVMVGLAAPAVSQVSAQPAAVPVPTLTPERMAASTAALAGLIAAVAGGLALARSRRAGCREGS